jgi:hypothetical protein
MAKAILSQNSNVGGITTPDFKLYYRDTVLKAARYWHKTRPEDQWNKIEDPDTNSCSYSHLIFDKGTKKKKMHRRKDSFLNKWC